MRQDDRAPFDRALRRARHRRTPRASSSRCEGFMTAGEIRALAAHAGIGPGVTALDLCRRRWPGRSLTRELGCVYLGVDSASAVAVARERAGDSPCRFAIAQVPPPDGFFDVVVLLETMLAFEDKDRLVREISAALGPSGAFAFTLRRPPLTTAERAACPMPTRSGSPRSTSWRVPGAGSSSRGRRTTPRARRDGAGAGGRVRRGRRWHRGADRRRALDELVVAHRLWVEWLDERRVRKLALVAERAYRPVGRSETPGVNSGAMVAAITVVGPH